MGYDEWTNAYHSGKNQITINDVMLYEEPVKESTEIVVTLDDLVLVEKGTDTNLLKDGDFNAQGAWLIGGGANFKFESTTGAQITITNEGKDPWDVIMYQPNTTLEQGKRYVLSFKGKADRDKKIQMRTSNKSYADYFVKAFDLTTEVQEFNYEFTTNLETSSELEFKIFMGAGI